VFFLGTGIESVLWAEAGSAEMANNEKARKSDRSFIGKW